VVEYRPVTAAGPASPFTLCDVVLVGRLFGLLRVDGLFGLAEVARELGLGTEDGVGVSGKSVAIGAEMETAVTWRPADSIANQAIPATEATATNHSVTLAKIRVFRPLTSREKPIRSLFRRISGQSESPSSPYRR
jgi:hypothetical protein